MRLAFTLAIPLLLSLPLCAQLDRANVAGTVTDATSAVVAGGSVRIESSETGLVRETVTNSIGVYLLPALPVGNFALTFRHQGFQTKRFDRLTLSVGQTRTVNVQLDVSAASTQVEVTAEAAPLQQNNAEIGLVVEQQQIRMLPLNGRNWSSFLMLAPGATNTGDGTQNSVRFFGRSRDDNNFTFDGVDATGVKDPRQEANLRLNISLDSIAEFRVNSGLYNAESGNGAGAQMNLVSKSGTNQYHGSTFEFFRNDKLDARRPIDAVKPPFRMNQFGANLGGRIIHDRTFFFSNFEGIRQRLSITRSGTVPSAAYRARVLASSPSLRGVLDAYPAGTSQGASADIDNLVKVGSQPTTENSGLIKVDHRFNDRTSMFVRYNLDDGSILEMQNAMGETRVSNFRTQNGVVQFQRLFSSSILGEVRLGVNRSSLHRDTNGTFGEGVSISGFTSLQVDRSEVEIGTSYSVIPNLTWNHGRHTMKFGGEYRNIQLVLADTGQVTTAFASRDDFAINKADSVQFASAQPGLKGLRPYYFVYAQDEIKVSRELTLSLGTRYEYYSVAHTADGRGRVLDFERCQGFCPAGTPWYFPDRNNWAPRFGLAWSPDRLGGKTVVRLGYGVFYGPGQIDDVNAPIDSYPETYALSQRDQPALSFPAVQFLGQAKSTGISARAQQRDRRDGYSGQWTISVQQQLPKLMVFETAYVGSSSHKLFGRSFLNVIDPATGKRPYPSFSNVDVKWNFGNSSMQALQMSLKRTWRSGAQWQTQYMWSHNISDNSGAGNDKNIMISNCRQCDRGSADWDLRHTFTTSGLYELPFGRGRKYAMGGVANLLLGGWTLSGIGTARTGLPFNVTVTRSSADLPDGVTTTPGKGAPPQRPDMVAGQSLYATEPNANGWLNAAAFKAPAKNTWGTLPRNALRGPGLWQTDFGMSKRTNLRESVNLEFRAELLNAFNRAQYGNPNESISNLTQFGRITSVINSGSTGFGGPRQIQFMLRLNY